MAEAQNQSIGANRQAVSPRKLMFLSEGIYVLKHFLSGSFLFGVPAIRLYQTSICLQLSNVCANKLNFPVVFWQVDGKTNCST